MEGGSHAPAPHDLGVVVACHARLSKASCLLRQREVPKPGPCMQVPILKAHLKGKWIGGQEWRAGNKKRSELISDYRCFASANIGSACMCCLAPVLEIIQYSRIATLLYCPLCCRGNGQWVTVRFTNKSLLICACAGIRSAAVVTMHGYTGNSWG
jgi:hypothetical protein